MLQLLTCSLIYIFMLRSVLREERQKRVFKSMMDAVCSSLGAKIQPQDLHTKVLECFNTDLCVM